MYVQVLDVEKNVLGYESPLPCAQQPLRVSPMGNQHLPTDIYNMIFLWGQGI